MKNFSNLLEKLYERPPSLENGRRRYSVYYIKNFEHLLYLINRSLLSLTDLNDEDHIIFRKNVEEVMDYRTYCWAIAKTYCWAIAISR